MNDLLSRQARAGGFEALPECRIVAWQRPSWQERLVVHSRCSPAEGGRGMHPRRWSPYRWTPGGSRGQSSLNTHIRTHTHTHTSFQTTWLHTVYHAKLFVPFIYSNTTRFALLAPLEVKMRTWPSCSSQKVTSLRHKVNPSQIKSTRSRKKIKSRVLTVSHILVALTETSTPLTLSWISA